ncbi:peptide chain release factor N(5)-glutamine methyltransferase [Candidatus Saccharibacteria bacterium]|nr:peptide chain release factor N(5)-glutamine methyltransferase [Candidatus Saccharibacteria bacterium]
MTAASSTTISNWLQKAQNSLEAGGIESARLDALVLLADETGHEKSWLLAHGDETLKASSLLRLRRAIERRTTHEPLAYIRGKIEFYGHEFVVDEHVLVPRPESEAILELLHEYLKNHTLEAIADIGTGSGALAISAKLAHPELTVYASDIDSACIELAKRNASTLESAVTFVEGDLLQPLLPVFGNSQQAYAILCNLPYVPEAYPVNNAAKHEPRLALFGGSDGLDLYRQLFTAIGGLSEKPIAIFTESLESQHDALQTIASKYGYIEARADGLAQLFSPA